MAIFLILRAGREPWTTAFGRSWTKRMGQSAGRIERVAASSETGRLLAVRVRDGALAQTLRDPTQAAVQPGCNLWENANEAALARTRLHLLRYGRKFRRREEPARIHRSRYLAGDADAHAGHSQAPSRRLF